MIRAAIFPNKYIQGRNAIREIANFIEPIGESAVLLVDRNVRSFIEPAIMDSAQTKGINIQSIEFGGECTWDEVNRIADVARSVDAQMIIGAGGGKTLDTAKAAAIKSDRRMIVLPTTASTDAPTSALSVIYTAQGEFQEYFFLPRNPDVVLVDTQIVANAPARFLSAGMGDALATWFEADTASRAGAKNMAGGFTTSTGLTLARLCFDTLIEYGPSALKAAEQHAITPALERVVEANTLLSGLGFESGGLAAAHSIHNGLTELKQTHDYLHGEKVAFGTLTQLILEDRSQDEIMTVLAFMTAVSLPACFEGIGLKNVSRDDLRRAAEAATAEGETIHNLPFEVSVDDVVDAMIAADSLGRTIPGACGWQEREEELKKEPAPAM
ncbi:MAG TPA: glycerol dehydrogenase [Armatimonadota bacterium]|nr:glycerol dehydrogenase [Armatimonadota bacterium]